MRKIFSIVFAVLAMFACTLHADAQKNNTATEKMFSIMGIDKQMNGGFEAMLPIVDQLASQLELNNDEKEELKNIYRDWFDNDIDREAMKAKMINLYAEMFSEKEIEDITAFYQTPLGQKFLATAPELMKLGAQIGIKEGQSKQHLLVEKLEPFLEKHKK